MQRKGHDRTEERSVNDKKSLKLPETKPPETQPT
jgi:hypothetical protein